jgi:hypothetical protein
MTAGAGIAELPSIIIHMILLAKATCAYMGWCRVLVVVGSPYQYSGCGVEFQRAGSILPQSNSVLARKVYKQAGK